MANKIPKETEKYIGKIIKCKRCDYKYVLCLDTIAYFIYLKCWDYVKSSNMIPIDLCGQCNE